MESGVYTEYWILPLFFILCCIGRSNFPFLPFLAPINRVDRQKFSSGHPRFL